MKVNILKEQIFQFCKYKCFVSLFCTMDVVGEETRNDETKDEQVGVAFVNKFLHTVGLIQPIDYIFMDYAMTQTREKVKKSTEVLHFLFHVIMGSETDVQPFPYCSFLELASHRYVNSVSESSEQDFKTLQRYIIYNFCPSESWKTRPVAPFSDFHLYFLDVLKPMIQHSAEELYQIIDTKRGETFFLLFGDHTANDFISVLFVLKDRIIVFHIMRPTLTADEYAYFCKWISTEIPTISRPQHEYAIFALPEGNLVLTDEGVQKRRIHWEEAFGDPNLMDEVCEILKEDGQESKYSDLLNKVATETLEEDVCLSCSS